MRQQIEAKGKMRLLLPVVLLYCLLECSFSFSVAPASSKAAALPELSQAEVRRYSRHLILPDVGVEGQRKLKAARVAAVGAGGLGSPALLYLAAAGVGHVGLIDDDEVDESNLQRQVAMILCCMLLPYAASTAHAP